MSNRAIKCAFIRDVFGGDLGAYRMARRADYCRVQLMWSCYIDGLCKSGIISQAQYNRATF